MATDLMRLRATDCKSFARLFKEHGNFEFLQNTMTTQVEVEKMCNDKGPQNTLVPVVLEDSLKTVFPAFSTDAMLLEVQGLGQASFLTHMQICSKTKTVTQLKMVKDSTSLPEGIFPPSLRQMGNNFMKQVYENYDCSVYDDMVESNSTVQFHGEPKRFMKGLEAVFKSVALAKSACEYKAQSEKRVNTQSTVVARTYYYDASRQEVTIMADRNVAVIFKPGVVSTRQMAVTLRFSDAGKIAAIRTYETEVKHLEEKYATTYGLPQAQWHSQHWTTSMPQNDVVVKSAASQEASETTIGKNGMPAAEVTKAASTKGTPAKAIWASETLTGISAATGVISMNWPLMLLVVLSVALARS